MNISKHVADLLSFMPLAKSKWSGVDAWAALGLCWGGKLVALTSGPDPLWKVSGQVHPGLVPYSLDIYVILILTTDEKGSRNG